LLCTIAIREWPQSKASRFRDHKENSAALLTFAVHHCYP